ncbi:GIY-YIG nuclease family protein [Fulvivirga sp. 29W222]|uniref:GIY-YIG nuclease family protein n=1 Tax=Fulvivirga marina TaxID=2494733 RepID=A0A937FUP8_9BACT|nr:GIY-YIG nuclease family protein [Fulvivirga marina]MBL6446384.1 GIY-YIG nuclease family protein [Fulvivirga marina]
MKTKKELKEEYKQMKFPMGVFQIKNLSNDKVLIDNSVDMESKWNRHRMELKLGNHRNKAFQSDWNEYGEDNFVFEVLSELKRGEEENVNYNKELKTLQEMVIEELNTQNLLY